MMLYNQEKKTMITMLIKDKQEAKLNPIAHINQEIEFFAELYIFQHLVVVGT